MPDLTNARNYEVVVQGTLPTTGSGTKRVYNVFNYHTDPGVALSNTQLADAFNANVWAAIAANLSADYTGVTTIVRNVNDPLDFGSPSTTAPDSGAIALPRLPSELCITIELSTGLRGKSYRGFKHLAGIPTASVTNDELNAGAVTAFAAALTAMTATITGGVGAAIKPMVLSRKFSQLKNVPTVVWGALVIAVELNKTLGTMRRRKEKTVR